MLAISPLASPVVSALAAVRFRTLSEAELQDAIGDVLTRAGIAFEREVRLAPRDRIDFLVGGLGIEVKVDGALAALTRQLWRYAENPRVEALLVVTTLRRLCEVEPANGKPVSAIRVGAGL